MLTYHIHIDGLVQGVGFRPWVYQHARALGMTGTVSNGVDGVHILCQTTSRNLESFKNLCCNHAPARAQVTRFALQIVEAPPFADFRIIPSDTEGLPNMVIPPDFGMCKTCRNELYDPADRRYRYAFTTCVNCGPRYSVITGLPYDRERSSMEALTPCKACAAEYADPMERRHHAQTLSCPDCRITMQLIDHAGNLLTDHQEDCIGKTVEALQKGLIAAVKGIGGFLLMADATQRKPIQQLRARKSRPHKPFALLYKDREMLSGDVACSGQEMALLESAWSPIVLVQLNGNPRSGIHTDLIAPGLDKIGVMLPYTPLFDLMMRIFQKPLIATSGNLTGSPIAFRDEDALRDLSGIAECILIHDREIVTAQDDSVVQIARDSARQILLRRSRGLAPALIDQTNAHQATGTANLMVDGGLAMGADLKSSFAIRHAGNTYISQYLGDLSSYDTQVRFEETCQHLQDLLDFQPEYILTDTHPNYFSSRLGHQLAEKRSVPVIEVQHHIAHFASVLFEQHLHRGNRDILGVIWDGTGYGEDGQIWGGEYFFFTRDRRFIRHAHFPYFPSLLGDKMAHEPRLSALALTRGLTEVQDSLRSKFRDVEWDLYLKKCNAENTLQTSSTGRLFDGVAALLGMVDFNTYEGQAAIYLEAAARRWVRSNGIRSHYCPEGGFSLEDLFEGLHLDLKNGKPVDLLAAKFHLTLVEDIRRCAKTTGIEYLAFSGGTFQNALLVDLCVDRLKEYRLFFHNQLSPNDENIAFGQLAFAAIQELV